MDNDSNDLQIIRYLTSIQYNIATTAILYLLDKIELWIESATCGAIIYGRPRIGKTRAIKYITSSLYSKYGNELPVFVWNITDHKPTEKNFYSEFLKTIGHSEYLKGTAPIMKSRLINALTAKAVDSAFRNIILFIDEAYLLHEKDFVWLMDIYNILNWSDIQLTVFLFGSNELKALKSSFRMANKTQIIGRFMVEEYEFKGIYCLKDVQFCMAALGKELTLEFDYGNILLLKYFFPDAYHDGADLTDLAKPIWDAFLNTKAKNIITEIDIPMKYFIDTIVYAFRNFGIHGEGIYYLTQEEFELSIMKTGYVNAEGK